LIINICNINIKNVKQITYNKLKIIIYYILDTLNFSNVYPLCAFLYSINVYTLIANEYWVVMIRFMLNMKCVLHHNINNFIINKQWIIILLYQ